MSRKVIGAVAGLVVVALLAGCDDNGSNRRPAVDAGSDRTITLPDDNVNMDATVTDDGLPKGSAFTTIWSKVSGPGMVTFGNANVVDATTAFSEAGIYVLRLTANDGDLSASDEVTVVVNEESTTNPPGDEVLRAVEAALNLRNFGSEKELEEYLKEEFLLNIQPVGYDRYWFGGEIGINEPLPFDGALAPKAEVTNETGGEHSTTNIQEEGVDESDVVKTDGMYLYVATGAEVKVVQARPAQEMTVVAQIPVRGRVDSMYLFGCAPRPNGKDRGPKQDELQCDDLLIVLYQNYSYDAVRGVPEGRSYPGTGVLLVDVSRPESPVALREYLFEGALETSRVTGGRLHLVQRFRPCIRGLRYWYYSNEEEPAMVAAQNQAIIDALTLDDFIPACYELDEAGAVTEAGRSVKTNDFYRPTDPEGHNIITVVTIDLKDLSSGFRSLAAVADVDIVYASTRALYLTHAIWSHTQDPQPPPLTGYDYSKQTVVRKFDLTAERVRNTASGRVWGHPLNQFSLGEYEDVLRIATTTGFTWGSGERTSRNHVFCLAKRQGAHLEVIGSVENMAPGERIYSARFLGERGFLVTFRQVDPLFTLDLSDPTNPWVVGELKVPGYSEYIHPLGPNHLLTIGKDSSSACLSIFDVSDFANPTLLYKEFIGSSWSDSEALRNHKAFTFWAQRDLLSIPIRLREYETDGWHYFTGLYVYRVTIESGFEHLGRIDTAPDGSTNYWYGWTRGVFIDDDVYAVTPEAVRAAATGDICGAVWSVRLTRQ